MGDLLRLAREFQQKVAAEAAEAAEAEQKGPYNPYLAVLTKDEFSAPPRMEGAEEVHHVEEAEEEDVEPDIAASRALTDDEAEALKELLRPHLRLNNVSCAFQAEADAEDFLNFAADLVNDREPLGGILDQLAELELEICDTDAMDGIEQTLEDFMVRMDGGRKDWREERAAREAAARKPQSLEEELLNSESHVSVDLSAKTNAAKYRQEMEGLFGAKRGSLKSRMAMYDESGKIIKRRQSEEEELDEGPQEKSVDQLRREELTAVMNDRSLSKSERSRRMDDIRAKYPDQGGKATNVSVKHAHVETKSLDASIEAGGAPKVGGVDLSSKNVAEKRRMEMAKMFGSGGKGLKSRMGMYDETGKIIKGAAEDEEEADEGPREKSVDQLRREEMMAIMKDKSLSKDEKAQRMEEIKLKYSDGPEVATNGSASAAGATSSGDVGGIDASAPSEEAAHAPLTEDETATLTSSLKAHLRLNNVSCAFQAEADAEDFLNYAIDLVNDGEPLDKILEDLADMELEICDADVLRDIGDTLEDFLVQRNGGKKNWREERAAREAAAAKPQSLEVELLHSEGHQRVDLSAKTAAAKSKREMDALFGGGKRGSLKSRMGMYDESGKIIKQNAQEEEEVDEGPKEKSVDQLRREEMMAVMKDKSLSKDEKAQKMEEIKLKYSDGPSPEAETTNGAPAGGATDGGSLDISARSEESAPRPLGDEEAETLAGLLRPHLKLNNVSCALDAEADAEDFLNYAIDLVNEGEPLDKITENLADMELEICDADALESIRDTLEDFLVRRSGGKKNWREERAARAAAANKPHSLEAELLSSSGHEGVDLSSKNVAEKRRMEMAKMFGSGGKGLKSRMGMYDETGKIIKGAAEEEEEEDEGPKEKTPDQLRREEMMAVMKDKSLSKDEKAKKMEEIKLKYDGPAAGTAATSASANGANARMSPTSNGGGLDIATKSEELAPKPLTDDEAKSLADLLRPHLKLNNVSWVDADVDAEKLLNRAIGLVNEGEPPSKIVENLAEMDMKICDDESLKNIGHSLEDFLKRSTQKKWRAERAAREAAANRPLSLEEELLKSENHVSIDLSAKKYGAKSRQQEMAGLFGAGGLKSRMGMYDETGKIVKQNTQEDEVVDEGPKEKSIDQLRRDELMAAMKDKSLSKDEKARKMEAIRQKYDGPSPEAEATTPAATSSALTSAVASSSAGPIDASAKPEESAHAPLTEDEIATLTSSLKSHLRLNNVSCAFQAEADAEDFLNYAFDLVNDGEPLDKILEDLADMELEICDDDALKNIGYTLEDFLVQRNGGKKNWREERAAREAAAAKQRASLEAELLSSESHVSVDLSAKTNATKYRQEKEALFGGGKGGGLKSRMGMYDSSGKLVKSSKQEAKEVDKGPKASSTDKLRRDELMKVMRDKSLSKDEKAKKMEEIRHKYDGGTSPAAGTAVTSSPTTVGSSFTSIDSEKIPPLPKGVNLSAKAASEKHHQEMASLFGKGGGNAMSKNRTSYEQNLEHDRVAQKLGRGEAVEHKPVARKSKPANNAPPTLDAQRRAELQSIMKDSSLSKDERKQKMDEVKAKYAAKAPNGGSATSRTSSLTSSISSTSSAGRRVDPSAKTYSATPAKELDAIACKSTSVRDRQNKYSNQSAIAAGRDQQMGRDKTSDQKTRRAEGFYSKRRNRTAVKVDSTGFALAENHLYGVYKQKKRQASHEYGGRF